ncbi:hypothetical protein GIB67_022458 [Kingdonia uniflora]|uniref:AP2/ERF domain-containing protein n=1 Tax=Kingdonia uniflora TaxID=39325 RepID=A0A7J7MUL9_9MAGN|nr:hypothetical protein GIB67_022458 [Kingdonia uniflora]
MIKQLKKRKGYFVKFCAEVNVKIELSEAVSALTDDDIKSVMFSSILQKRLSVEAGINIASDLPKIVQAGYNLIPYFIFSPQEGKANVILRVGQMVKLDGRRSEGYQMISWSKGLEDEVPSIFCLKMKRRILDNSHSRTYVTIQDLEESTLEHERDANNLRDYQHHFSELNRTLLNDVAYVNVNRLPTVFKKELDERKNLTRQEYVASLIRYKENLRRQNGRLQAMIRRLTRNSDLYLGTFSSQEEAVEVYDIVAIKFRGNVVTNFDITRYDVYSIMEMSTLALAGATWHIQEAYITEKCLNAKRTGDDNVTWVPK